MHQAISAVETMLAESQPFGAPTYIQRCSFRSWQQQLETLAPRMTGAEALLARLRAAPEHGVRAWLADPVARGMTCAAIDGGVGRFPSYAGDVDVALRKAAVWHSPSEAAAPRSPIARGAHAVHPLGATPAPLFVWLGALTPCSYGRAIGVLRDVYLPVFRLVAPSSEQLRVLEDGAALLVALLPALAPSALAHTGLVFVTELDQNALPAAGEPKSFKSASHPRLPGATFLSPVVLRNRWEAAEHLLHESLHQKFFEIERTHSITLPGYQLGASPVIRPPWRESSARFEWPLNRALSVLHVYVHLALFFRAAAARERELARVFGPLGDPSAVEGLERSMARATFLVDAAGRFSSELGLAGRHFLAVMRAALGALASSASAAGASHAA